MIKQFLKSRQARISALIVLIGAVLASLILIWGKRGEGNGDHADEHGAPASSYPKGPHGGRLLSAGDLSIEVTIYEEGVPPVFRIYPYYNDAPLNPSDLTLRAEVHRLGGVVDPVGFTPENDYLLGDAVVYEPHSFDVVLVGRHQGESHRWKYSQIEGRTRLTADAAKTSDVVVERAGPATLRIMLELPGEIVANTDRVAHVVPRLSGVVTEVRRSVGDRVGRGEVLAVIQSRELADLAAMYAAASKRVSLAQTTAAREDTLFKRKIGAEQDLQQAEHALAEARIEQQTAMQKLRALGLSPQEIERIPSGGGTLTRFEIRAPFGGTVIERRVAAGEAVSADIPLFQIADLTTVWVDISVPAHDLPNVRSGQQVTVLSSATGAKSIGTVTFISALLSEQTRSAKARVLLANPQNMWRPGLFVTVQLVQEEVNVPLAVRAEALQTFRDWDVVFMQDGEFYEVRPLELGRRDDEWVEVLSGISSGTPYVARNSFVLKADVEKSGATHDH